MSPRQVQEAERNLISELEDADTPLDPRSLRENAQNGSTWDVVDMAFWRLINRRRLIIVGDRVELVSD